MTGPTTHGPPQAGPRPGAKPPLISVITVVRNRKRTIRQSVESVLAQSYAPLQYIVIDGASTDGTLEILNEYRPRMSILVSEPDKGIYDAMNKGLGLATGDYIIFLNSDDWYDSRAIELLAGCALASNADVVHADAYSVDGDGRVIGRINGWMHDGFYTKGMPLRHETMLVRRDVYDRFGSYDDSYRILADYELVARLHSGGCTFYHCREPVLYFRMTGISNVDDGVRIAERKIFFKSRFPFLRERDLEIMAQGASKKTRLLLLLKYLFHSELFARSMACNIDSPRSLRIVALVLCRIGDLRTAWRTRTG